MAAMSAELRAVVHAARAYVDEWRNGVTSDVDEDNWDALVAAVDELPVDVADPDEMEEHFLAANERMGAALVEIGMALGLPRPAVGGTWGAPEILARIAQVMPVEAAARRYVEAYNADGLDFALQGETMDALLQAVEHTAPPSNVDVVPPPVPPLPDPPDAEPYWALTTLAAHLGVPLVVVTPRLLVGDFVQSRGPAESGDLYITDAAAERIAAQLAAPRSGAVDSPDGDSR